MQQLKQGNVSFKLKKDKAWAVVDWVDGSTFYMPVFGVHPKVHSKSVAIQYAIQEVQKLESLILEYKAIYEFLSFVYGVGSRGSEFNSKNLGKILNMLRLPHLSGSPNQNPITFDKLMSEI